MRSLAILFFAALSCFWTVPALGQFMELRSPFERFSDFRIIFGASTSTPPNSQWNEFQHKSVPTVRKVINFNQMLAVEYWQMRLGMMIYRFPTAMHPFLIYNPEFDFPYLDTHIGGDTSRWALSLRGENLFASGVANELLGGGQSDKSRFPDRNSFSFIFSYWFGDKPDSSVLRSLVEEAFALGATREDVLANRDVPEVRYSTRNGLSVGFGLGTGKYSGSGPISRHLNFLNNYDANTQSGFSGINPLALVRYRLRNLIVQFDVAGDDVNLNFVLRNLKRLDIETGILHLEHLIPRDSRGPHRPEAYLAFRMAIDPTTGKSPAMELGDDVLDLAEDTDGDGISNMDEVVIYKTNPYAADTDGDGINDGDEVNQYKTNPTASDTDGDGINDGDEVKVLHTSPRLADTDGDGLPDGEEIKLGTNPLRQDTDTDELVDGDEVKFGLDPLNPDSDGDGLADGEEIRMHKTNPKLFDTDGDELSDGVEVRSGDSDPLKRDSDGDGLADQEDKCPSMAGPVEAFGCPDLPQIGNSLFIAGIKFETGKSLILPESEPLLERADSILRMYPTIKVSIDGHTDNVGDSLFNKRLSLERAQSVRQWLIDRGTNPQRLEARGYGQDQPIDINTTEEGRQRNRRIEFRVIDNNFTPGAPERPRRR